MCIIIYSPNAGFRPSMETLDKCQQANPHGIGIVTMGDDKYFDITKAVSLEHAKNVIDQEQGAVALHFRYATAGGNGKNLCHPFPCTSQAQTWLDYRSSEILMTNGTWINWKQAYEIQRRLLGLKKLKGAMSDTRALAHLVGHTRKHTWLAQVSDKHPLEKRVRSLYMSKDLKDPKFYGTWTEHEGCKFSNMRWNTKPTHKYQSYWQRQFPWSRNKIGAVETAEPNDILGFSDEDNSWIEDQY